MTFLTYHANVYFFFNMPKFPLSSPKPQASQIVMQYDSNIAQVHPNTTKT